MSLQESSPAAASSPPEAFPPRRRYSDEQYQDAAAVDQDTASVLPRLRSGWIRLLLQPRPFLAGSRRRAAVSGL